MRTGPVIFLVSHASQGGVQELWSDLAHSFRALGHDARQIALYPMPGRPAIASGAPWTYVVAARPTGLVSGARMFLALARLLYREQPAMVFAAMPAANVIAPLAAAVLPGRHTCVSISHHSPVQTYNRFLNFLDNFTGMLKSTRTVICVAQAVGTSLRAKPDAYRNKVRIIPNALSPRVERDLAQLYLIRTQRLSPARRVVALGRLSKEKNYPTLLRCATLLRGIEIVIIGGGPEEQELKQEAARLGVDSQVRFLGMLDRDAALAELAGADVFIQPSIFEGHSLALIEAAKLGLPLVVSDAASQIEAISAGGVRHGIVVGVHDHVAMSRALQQLVDDDMFRVEWAAKAYSLGAGATFENMLEAYDELVCA
jgi:glycosyltransferase involved in cell wall biosynthesis